MSEIAGSFNSSFPATGTLGLSTGSIFGATSGTQNAASLLSVGQTTKNEFTVLGTAASSVSQSATTAALSQGKLTSGQHKVVVALGTAGAGGVTIPWNADGTEPSTLANIRGYNWVKLARKTFDPHSGKVNGAIYQLTAIGRQIYKRTGGAAVTTTAASAKLTSTAANSDVTNTKTASPSNTASITSNLRASVSTAIGLLGSVGVNITA